MKDMQSFILGIVVVSVTLVIGIYIISQIQTNLYTTGGYINTTAVNSAGDAVTALSSGTPWITILVVVGFAVIVLGMLTSGFSRAAGGGGTPIY